MLELDQRGMSVCSSPCSNSVHNLSGLCLPNLIISILALGANFIIDDSQHLCSTKQLFAAVTRYLWLLYCRCKFRRDTGCPRFLVKKGPPEHRRFMNGPSYLPTKFVVERTERALRSRLEYNTLSKHSFQTNFPLPLRSKLLALRAQTATTVKQADKGLGLVILRTEQYDKLILDHLQDENSFTLLPNEQVPPRIQAAASELQRVIRDSAPSVQRQVPSRAKQYLKYLQDWRCCELPAMYGLIKVHKTPVAVRPIVTCQQWLTTGLSKVCAYELNLLIQQHLPHVLKAPTELAGQLQTFRCSSTNPNSLTFATADVVGLYPSIPIDEALQIIRSFVAAVTCAEYANLIHLWMTVVFRNALVSFKERTYVQHHGFPMGTPLAPAAANIYMACKEDWLGLHGSRPLASCFTSPQARIALFSRYIDDYTIVLLHCSAQDVENLFTELSKRIAPHLSVEWQHTIHEMVTLDLHVRKRRDFAISGRLVTQTYTKPGHRFQLTCWASRMPRSTIKSVAISGTMRLARTCSLQRDFELMRHLFVNRLMSRGIPLLELRKWTESVDWQEVRIKAFDTTPTHADFNTDDATSRSSVPLHLSLSFDFLTAASVPPNTLARLGRVLGDIDPRLRERHLLCWYKGKSLGTKLRVAAE